MDVVLSVKFSQLLKRHLADEYSTERLWQWQRVSDSAAFRLQSFSDGYL